MKDFSSLKVIFNRINRILLDSNICSRAVPSSLIWCLFKDLGRICHVYLNFVKCTWMPFLLLCTRQVLNC